MSCNVFKDGAMQALPLDTTPGSLGTQLVLCHAPSSDSPGVYYKSRVPGLTLVGGDEKTTRYLRVLAPTETFAAALSALSFPPACLYALPASAELLLLEARGVYEDERGYKGMGVAAPSAAGSSSSSAPPGPLFSHEALQVLTTLENSARLSPEFQALFSAAERDEYNRYQQATWMELCSELQYVLVWLALCHRAAAAAAGGDPHLAAFAAPPPQLAQGLLHCINATPSAATAAAFAAGLAAGAQPLDAVRGVHLLRTAGHAYPATCGQISLYHKYNRANLGRLRGGAAAPNTPLFTLAGAPSDLHACIAAAHPRPLVVLAGSYS